MHKKEKMSFLKALRFEGAFSDSPLSLPGILGTIVPACGVCTIAPA
jgi:hypothetical protein